MSISFVRAFFRIAPTKARLSGRVPDPCRGVPGTAPDAAGGAGTPGGGEPAGTRRSPPPAAPVRRLPRGGAERPAASWARTAGSGRQSCGAGLTFWLAWKRLSGSYARFTCASRS
ncbi:hypothetical protein GCM10010421_55370 [Streptomyces glaucus]|uniref:Secreted protein n=1 Tax=Streptomyces glaucus TaxID=284029 RepID=A0ABP5XN96_9ACTN